ncbi:YLR027Cp-like protein, partial [Ascoidea rubescens DSM 1968]
MPNQFFQNIVQLPPDPLFGVSARSKADTRPERVDLVLGAYRDNDGRPWILPSVKLAEKKILSDPNYNHEYLPIEGFKSLTNAASKITLGEDSSFYSNPDKIVSIQSLSGTGSLHIAAKFLYQWHSNQSDDPTLQKMIFVSAPTWSNHIQIFQSCGFKVKYYKYWDYENKSIDLSSYLSDLSNAPDGSIILLHSCAHNPTGLDPNHDQWLQILDVIKQKKHLPIFDTAYQGFASGDLDKDAWALRKGVEVLGELTPIIICQSFAKNTGMYGERVGCIHLTLPNFLTEDKDAIYSQLKKITRS